MATVRVCDLCGEFMAAESVPHEVRIGKARLQLRPVQTDACAGCLERGASALADALEVFGLPGGGEDASTPAEV